MDAASFFRSPFLVGGLVVGLYKGVRHEDHYASIGGRQASRVKTIINCALVGVLVGFAAEKLADRYVGARAGTP